VYSKYVNIINVENAVMTRFSWCVSLISLKILIRYYDNMMSVLCLKVLQFLK